MQTAVGFTEGKTGLMNKLTLPARGLCGRKFKAQLVAKNAAGDSAVFTTSATYTMPACGKGRELDEQ